MLDTKQIGKRLIALRGNRTQAEVAEAVGASVSAVAMYERGERMPRDEMKVKLSQYFHSSIEDIFFAE